MNKKKEKRESRMQRAESSSR